MNWIWIGLAGAAGSIARVAISEALRRLTPDYPTGTLVVNVIGSFAVGFLAGPEQPRLFSPDVRTIIVAGFLGALTTFSAFQLDAYRLTIGSTRAAFFAYLFGNLALGAAALVLGKVLGDSLPVAK